MPTYTLHPAPLTTLFAEIEGFALAQENVFAGTAGNVSKRRNASRFEFYAHQYYDALGARRERYVAGPAGSSEADGAAEELRARIADANRIAPLIRLLAREGFQLADSRTFATLAALHNHQFFAAGGLLAGSHAYGVILNRLGVRAAAYRTEDVDLARGGPLSFVSPSKRSFAEILRDSGMEFVELPQLDPRTPATSYKQRGRSTFQIELLAPARGEEIGTRAVPELEAHACTLPFLGYLLKESQLTAVLAREGSCAVRVPIAERFAIHKLILSVLRHGGDAKSRKDRTQAIVLCAALGEGHPGALTAARDAIPRRAIKYFRKALVSVRATLEETHPRAWEELSP